MRILRKHKLYIPIKKYDENIYVTMSPVTSDEILKEGFDDDYKYYIFEPEKLIEVNISLEINNR